MSANDMQVGGDHYAQEYQHWDWICDTGMGYLEGCATKYISRWRKKHGIEDLKKARHYVAKALELKFDSKYHNRSIANSERMNQRVIATDLTYKFIESGDYDDIQSALFLALCEWSSTYHLQIALGLLDVYIESAQKAAGVAAEVGGTTPPGNSPCPSLDVPGRAAGQAQGATTQGAGGSTSTEKSLCKVCMGSGKIWTSQGYISCTCQRNTDHPAPFGYEGED